MNLSKYDEKTVKVTMNHGEVFWGYCLENSAEYNESEFGRNEQGIQIQDYLIFKSQIRKIEILKEDRAENPYRRVEEEQAFLFSVKHSISEHLARWEDNDIADKYDHNCFEYSAQPSKEEFALALEYQKERGDTFIKLEGNTPLEDSFGLEEGVILTMAYDGDFSGWKTNAGLTFASPKLRELEEIEVRHFGPLYGEDFCRRNIRRLYEELTFHGAYLEDKLVGACYSFTYGGYTCVDGLIVDEHYRNRRIATSLLVHVMEENKTGAEERKTEGKTPGVLFLHADADDTPVEMYKKMGFVEVDRLYEYLSTDIGALC